MKKIVLSFILYFSFTTLLFSQRILFQTDFESIPLQSPDSIPIGWWKLDVDHNNSLIGWAVRDTSVNFGGNTRVRAHNSAKSLEIPWYAGNGGNMINDDWVWSDSLHIQTGDSLIFWMLIGSDSTFQPYLDSMQVYVCSDQDPLFVLQKLATIISNRDSLGVPLNNNVWTIHKFNLSAFNGQKVYVAWRYNMNVSVDGLWCNIDDVFIGNHSAIGIRRIGTNVPTRFDLKQNYPNPFNPSTTFEFSLPKAENVRIILYNTLGQQVKTILDEYKPAGYYKVDFEARGLSSGLYFYRMITPDFVKTNKMILVK